MKIKLPDTTDSENTNESDKPYLPPEKKVKKSKIKTGKLTLRELTIQRSKEINL